MLWQGMIRATCCLPPLALALVLSSCASGADYPSLARRDAERITAERVTGTAQVATPAPSPPAAPPSPQLAGRVAQLVEQARASHQRFTARRGATERLVGAARGAAVASESWSVATTAVADLEAARNGTATALAELDQIYVAEAVTAAETGETGNVDMASTGRAQVEALAAEEQATIDRLRGRLRG